MRMTPHAMQRWGERHPTLELEHELATARRVGKRLRALLLIRHPGDRHFMVTPNGVLFVVSMPKRVVITVLVLSEAKRRARAWRRAEREANAFRMPG